MKVIVEICCVSLNPKLVSIAILAGGQSKRMGRDKAFLEVGGVPTIERIIAQVQPLTNDLFISTNFPEKYKPLGLRTVTDIYPHKATLGGIYSAIEAAYHYHVLIVACDMPFLNSALLGYLINLAPTAEIIAPLTGTHPETLHTIYSKPCLPVIKPRLLANQLRVLDFFAEVTVHYVSSNEIAKFDPIGTSFINMNSPADWQIACDLVQK